MITTLMNITEILNSIPETTKKTFNKVQKLKRKLSKARSAVLFNDICLKEFIWESGHSPDTFSLDVICSVTIQAGRTTNTLAVGPMCGLHDYR